MSTAIERLMRARGDLKVLHEPFMYAYYSIEEGRSFTGFNPDQSHPDTYSGVQELIQDASREGPVFFKDMAYYVDKFLPEAPEFAANLTHAFLIRDPAETVISYAKRQSDFSLREVGVEASWSLHESLKSQGHAPIVIDANKVRRDPQGQMRRYWSHIGLEDCPNAFSWGEEIPEDWQSVASWHQGVLQSSGIQPPEVDRDIDKELAALGAPYTEFVDHHRRYYERLKQYS